MINHCYRDCLVKLIKKANFSILWTDDALLCSESFLLAGCSALTTGEEALARSRLAAKIMYKTFCLMRHFLLFFANNMIGKGDIRSIK